MDVYHGGHFDSSRTRASDVDPEFDQVESKWDLHVTSLFGEWKMVQFGSGLLVPAILTIFQIPGAGNDPITRVPCLLSLICALVAVVFSSIFTARIHCLRGRPMAIRWRDETFGTTAREWWNLWTFLAMPSVWASWSAIFFVISILCILWVASADEEAGASFMSHQAAAGMSTVLAFGLLCFYLVMKTFTRFEASIS